MRKTLFTLSFYHSLVKVNREEQKICVDRLLDVSSSFLEESLILDEFSHVVTVFYSFF